MAAKIETASAEEITQWLANATVTKSRSIGRKKAGRNHDLVQAYLLELESRGVEPPSFEELCDLVGRDPIITEADF